MPSDPNQYEVAPFPSNVLSGWLPDSNSRAWGKFFAKLKQLSAERPVSSHGFSPAVKKLLKYLKTDSVAKDLFPKACVQNDAIVSRLHSYNIPRIESAKDFALMCHHLLTQRPEFYDGILVGVPFAALMVGIDATQAGSKLLATKDFNDHMKDVLNEWADYLKTKDSAQGFTKEGEQWLSDEAKKSYNFELWKKDNETLPYWNTWDSFFTRHFLDEQKERPVASPDDDRIVNSPNDGVLFRWDRQIHEDDVFWFKDMKYSLRHIFSSPVSEQQKIIIDKKLVSMFEGGYIFQTFLSPYNFHRWWVPVNGTVLFDPFVIPGAYYRKLVIPDIAGATTASLPYLVQVNCRGVVVIQTEKYGYVCCIPIGMAEVSTVKFDDNIKKGAQVKKGQPLGKFQYGGSSFAILFQKVPGKELIFHDGEKHILPRPNLPTNSSGAGGTPVNVGQQIGEWFSG